VTQLVSQGLMQEQAIELGTENPTRCWTVGKLAWTQISFWAKAEWGAEGTVFDANCPVNGRDGSRIAFMAGAPPLWRPHASRWGANRVELSDGRVVWSGGQYEDSYDPLFCIFNDILVEHPSGRAPELFTYPREVFPPTDNHACVEADGYLYLFGNQGYPEDRTPDRVQVLRLNLTTYAMERLRTDGWSPPWLIGQRMKVDDAGEQTLDLRHGMTLVAGESLKWKESGYPEVHFNGVPFGLLVKRDEIPVEIADIEDMPTGADATVSEENSDSLNERFQVRYNAFRELQPGMRLEFEKDEESSEVRVLAESGDYLGLLCVASQRCYGEPPLQTVHTPPSEVRAYALAAFGDEGLLKFVQAPDYKLGKESSELNDNDFAILTSMSAALGKEPEGPIQKACESPSETWQSAYVQGRDIAISLNEKLFSADFHHYLFNLDALTWSEPEG